MEGSRSRNKSRGENLIKGAQYIEEKGQDKD